MKRTVLYTIELVALSSIILLAQGIPETGDQLTATRIIEKSQLAFYYPGDDMKARVTMELIDKKGGKRVRVLTMLRLNEEDGGNQKYFIYFHEPGDVRQMTFMVWKYPQKDDDRWIFVPAVDLIRRIAANDKRSSFVGSDFSYEDISGRDVSSDTHELIGEETIEGRDCYLVQSIPVDEADYSKKLSWIDKKTFLPLKESYYDSQGELFRRFSADEIEEISTERAVQTVLLPPINKQTMTNVKRNHMTEVKLES